MSLFVSRSMSACCPTGSPATSAVPAVLLPRRRAAESRASSVGSAARWTRQRDFATGLQYVPAAPPGRPRQLLVVLHGAGGSAGQAFDLLGDHAGDHALLLLCPQSAGSTWDVIAGGYGPDVRRIDDALTHVFARHGVGIADVGVAGFSDGASYALSLAVANGTCSRPRWRSPQDSSRPCCRRDAPVLHFARGERPGAAGRAVQQARGSGAARRWLQRDIRGVRRRPRGAGGHRVDSARLAGRPMTVLSATGPGAAEGRHRRCS